MKLKVSRISHIVVNGEDHIRLFGYDENGNSIKQLKKFKNYVFAEKDKVKNFPSNFEVEEGEYLPYDYNIRPKQLKKLVNRAPRSFYINDKIRKLSYQSDIKPELKYVLENDIEFSRKRHIFFFDIETYFDIEEPDTNSDARAIAPITSITAYSNLYKEYFVLYWHPTKDTEGEDLIIEQKGNIGYYICKDEKILLTTFCSMIKDFNIDIITGWYSHGYDVPYILKRLDANFGSKNLISPVGNAWMGNRGIYDDYYKIRISGLDSIDMMEVVQKMNFNLQNNKLDTAAESILGEEYGKLKTANWRDWEVNLEGFLEYAVRDVELLVLIDDKLKLFEYLIQMQILSSIITLNDIQSVTRLIDSLTIKKYWGRYIFPDSTRYDRTNFMGGLTIDPISGIHKDVNVYDFASLYPTTIIAYNISPETFLFSEEELGKKAFEEELRFLRDNNIEYFDTGYSNELFGKRYVFMSQTEKVGVLPELTKELYQMRKEEKKKAKNGRTKDDRMVADKRQYAIKIILNSIYGAMGFNFYRLFVPECADAITFMARNALKFAMNSLSTYGTVLYGDTDSCASNSIIRYRMKEINSCTIEMLFDIYGKDIFVENNRRYFAKLPNIELEYYDEETSEIKWGEVEFIEKHLVDKPIFKVHLENGNFVEVTEDHSLIVLRNNRCVEAKVYELDEDDVFYTIDGETKLKKIEPVDRGARWVYDIQMKDSPHMFFANGVLVHNSIFLRVDKNKEDELTEFISEFNKNGLFDFIKSFNPGLTQEFCEYELEHEKTLSHIYLGDRKKRYYSIQDNGEKYIHGLNIIKKDTPKYIKRVLDDLCEKAVRDEISLDNLREIYENLHTADYDEIAVHKYISKRLDAYKKTMPQHVKGTLFANEHFDLNISNSDSVYLFYINNFAEPDVKPDNRTGVICLRKEDFELIGNNDKFEIDYMELMEKQFIQPLREFDKMPIVEHVINEWCEMHKDNYRKKKDGTYAFKKAIKK